jgi:hypothetical protein
VLPPYEANPTVTDRLQNLLAESLLAILADRPTELSADAGTLIVLKRMPSP